jgi:hypothetical protein
MARLFFILFLTGCASVTYHAPTGDKVTYSRFGSQSISGLELSKAPDGSIIVKIDKNSADAGQIAEVLVKMAQMTVPK